MDKEAMKTWSCAAAQQPKVAPARVSRQPLSQHGLSHREALEHTQRLQYSIIQEYTLFFRAPIVI